MARNQSSTQLPKQGSGLGVSSFKLEALKY